MSQNFEQKSIKAALLAYMPLLSSVLSSPLLLMQLFKLPPLTPKTYSTHFSVERYFFIVMFVSILKP